MPVSASANAGSVRWRSRSTTPVPSPKTGNQPSRTAKTYRSRIPVANAGALTPTTPTATMPRSVDVRLRTAASTPSGIPATIVMRNARPPSWSVSLNRSPITPATGSFVLIERPKSKRAARCAHSQYWPKNESFRWYCSRIAAIVSGVDGLAPSRICSGLPGAR